MTREMECAGRMNTPARLPRRGPRLKRQRRFGSINANSETRLILRSYDPKRCRRFALPPHSKYLAFLLCSLLLLLACASAMANVAPQKRTRRSSIQKPKVPPKPKIDYGKFSHATHVLTQKLACNSCHKAPSKNWNVVRKGDAAFQDVTD